MIRKIGISGISLLILLTGCSAEIPQPAETVYVEVPAEDVGIVTVPNVVGLSGDKADDAITAERLTTMFDAGEEEVWMSSNWQVNSQSPAAGTQAEAWSEIVLSVTRIPSETDSGTVPAPAAPVEITTTPSGLEIWDAEVACENRGLQEYPFGFEPHYFIGVIAERVEGDTYFVKVETTLTNEYNAVRESVMECVVSGTPDSPSVDSFYIY